MNQLKNKYFFSVFSIPLAALMLKSGLPVSVSLAIIFFLCAAPLCSHIPRASIAFGRWWCKMIINVGNKFNLILVVCAAVLLPLALFLCVASFVNPPAFAVISKHSQVENLIWFGKWILLSDGFLWSAIEARRLLTHPRSHPICLMNRKLWWIQLWHIPSCCVITTTSIPTTDFHSH